jgi:diguanylate cyclase (GGDEF)-like protein
VGYVLALLLAAILVGAGYLLGARRARTQTKALESTLDEREEKLTLVEHELLRRSSIDPVTGLHTQQHFQEFLEREWRRGSRDRQFVSVLMVEVDYFRAFNERQGKPEGDASLKRVADAMKVLVRRPSDVVARYGGAGKFGIVLGHTDATNAMAMAERLRSAVEALQIPHPVSTTSGVMTATLGVASAMPDREGAWQDIELIAAAERALAVATESGRNRIILDKPVGTPG